MKMLNLGCGAKYHKDWTNIDFNSHNKNIIVFNLLKGIPYPTNSFDVVYHSHLIEHLVRSDGDNLIKECYRVLKPKGIIRIATPNLENIVNNYIKYLHGSLNSDKIAEFKYDFTLIEMYDQCIRTFNGGELGQLYKKGKFLDPDFIYKRTGFKQNIKQKTNIYYTNEKRYIFFQNKLIEIIHKLCEMYSQINIKKDIYKIILGNEYEYYRLGKFRLNGEIHQCMYDRFSLSRVLRQNKFINIKVCRATKSRISNWNSYKLDTNPDGTIYKPSSIYIEAIK